MPRKATADDGYYHEGDGRGLSKRRQQMARQGGFQGLWQALLDSDWDLLDQAECLRLLLQAAEVAARTDPQHFSAAIFARMMAFGSYLLLRSHHQLGTLLDRHGASMRRADDLPLPYAAVEALPALLQLSAPSSAANGLPPDWPDISWL